MRIRLTEKKIRVERAKIVRFYLDRGWTGKEIGRLLNVHEATISRIRDEEI